LLALTETPAAVTFDVRVVPRAAKTAAAGVHGDALKVRVAAPPVEGAANEELVRYFARTLGVAPRAVEILSGQSSRTKVVRICGATAAQVRQLADEPA
jgi:uncharacterized protein